MWYWKAFPWFVVCGLAACLAWAAANGWSGAGKLTENQKEGLEFLGQYVNSNSLESRKATAHNRLCERVIADCDLGKTSIGMYAAWEKLNAEMESRTKAGLTEEVVAWFESEAGKTDAEIVARWGVPSKQL